MVDIAALGLKVTATGITKTTQDLDKFSVAAKAAGVAASKPINVNIAGGAKAVAEIRQVEKAMAGVKAASASGVNLGGGANSVNALAGAMRGLLTVATAFAAIRLGRTYLDIADAGKTLTAQLRLATAETGSFVQAQQDVRRIASETRSDLESTAKLYGNFQRNANQLGITQAEAARATETVAKAFRISGAATVEASQGTRQLVQALQSGVLRGDEFNTIMEAAPRLSKLFADSLGVTVGQLRKMAEEGELTSDKLTKALTDKKFTETLDREFKAMPVTFEQAVGQMQTSLSLLIQSFDRGAGISDALTKAIMGAAGEFKTSEDAAFSFGQTVRVEIAGMIDGFRNLWDIIKDVGSAIGVMGRVFSETMDSVLGLIFPVGIAFRAFRDTIASISGNIGWSKAITDGLSDITNYLGPLGNVLKIVRALGADARKSEAANAMADAQNDRINGIMGFQNGQFKQAVPAINAVTTATKKMTDAQREAKKASEDAARELKRQTEAAQSYAKGLEDQAAKFGKSAIEIRNMDAAAAAAKAPTAALAKSILDAAAALNKLEIDKAVIGFDKMITAIYNEIELSGLVGKEREMRALALEKEGKMAEWAAQGLDNLEARWMQYASARMAGIEENDGLRKQAKEAEKLAEELARVNYQLDGFINSLQGIGGLGGVIGNVLGGLQSGDFAGLGAGGALLNIALGGKKDYEKQGDIIAQRISTVFGTSGPFAKTMGNLLQGAGTGAMVGQTLFKSQAGQMGSSIGGAIGQAVGSKLLSSLGSAAGPLGAVAGALIGGLVGGLFKKDKYGSAAITNSGVQITGNNAEAKAGSTSVSTGITQTLQKIADTLGGTLGQFAVSIGLTNGKWNVNPGTVTGMIGTTKQRDTIDFKEDQAGAIKWALQNAIQDGAIAGVRAGTQAILKASGDIEVQLQKALDFEGVFAELEQKTNPVEYAVKQVEKWFGKMTTIFNEAGATSEEYAQLEQLKQLKLADAQKQAVTADDLTSKRRELEIQLMEAQGDVMGALAAARAQELAELPESLRAIQEQIYAAELLGQKRNLEIQLMQAMGDTVGATNAQRQLELASMDESLRPIQERIYALNDEAAAEAIAAEAATKAAALDKDRRGLEAEIMRLSGDAAGALAMQRQLELESMDASLRPFQERIYALQDEASAAQASADALAAAQKLATDRRGLEIELMEALGQSAEALAARRADELVALDPLLRGLQAQIHAAQDAAQAQAELNAANEAAAAIASERRGLEIQIMELEGNASGALAAQRQIELAAMDESLLPLQQRIYALSDEAAALQKATEVAKQRRSLEIQLMDAMGNSAGALAAQRADELGAMDESLRVLQKQVWAEQDASAARQEAIARGREAAAESQRIAEEAARRAEELAKQRMDMENRIWVLQGRGVEALARQRGVELAAMDASLRGLQMTIWALEDAKEAEEARTAAIADAKGVLADAYKREGDALRDTIDRFAEFGRGLREFRATLYEGATGMSDAYRIAQAQFVDTASAARMGDESALGKLADVSKGFLAASMDRATSLVDYQRDVARVARAVDDAIVATDDAMDYARAQLDALNLLVVGIDLGNEIQMTTAQALQAYLDAQAVTAPTVQPVEIVPPTSGEPTIVVTDNPQTQAQLDSVNSRMERLEAILIAIADTNGLIANRINRVTAEDYFRVGNDADTPLGVVVGNDATNPVPVDQVV